MKRNQTLSWVVLGIFLVTLGFLAVPSKVQAAAPGSLIGASTTTLADAASFQRKSFFAQGRFWVFYSNPPNMVFRTSLDGIIWSAETIVRNGCSSGEQFSVWSDGTNAYYAFGSGATGAPIIFRRGTLNGGGTITWSPEVNAVAGAANVTLSHPSIALDSTGRAWIGYRRVQVVGAVTNRSPFITRNNNTNGTWANAPGFPYDLAGWTAAGWVVVPVPLDSGKMVAIYVSPGHYVRARNWNGTAWVGGFTSTKAVTNNLLSAVGKGDDVHIAFLETSVIHYIKYNSSSNSLTPEELVQSGLWISGGPTYSAPVMSMDNGGGDLHLFWAGSPTANRIFYKQNAGGKWDASVLEIVNEDTEKLTNNWALTTPFFTDVSQGEIVFYLTKLASHYNVKSSRGNTSISLKKTGPALAYLGDTITYNFEVKNNGKVSLSNVSVTDPLLGGVIYSAATLNAGASASFSKNYTVPNSAPPVLVNRAVASGKNGSTIQVDDSDSCGVKIVNPVSVKKTGPPYAFDGDEITFTITIRNDWNQPLEITKVVDTHLGEIFNGSNFLAIGATWVHTLKTTPAWQNNPLVNTVTVWAKKGSHEVTASDTLKLYPLTIKKDVVGEEDDTEFEVEIKDWKNLPYPGTKPFKISEKNPKRIWLSRCTHYFKEVILYPNCYRLVPDESYVIKYYPQYNSEFAQFKYEAEKDKFTEITFKNKNYCKICVDKSGPGEACAGDKITYTYTVWNCSEIPSTGDQPILYDVKVTDDKLLFTENIGTLNPGASKEFTKDHTLPMAPGSYKNTATATGKHDIAHHGGFPTTTKTVSAKDTHTVNVEDCRKAQICGFKWNDDDGDGKWTVCHHLLWEFPFAGEDISDWKVKRGVWLQEDGFLKQNTLGVNPSDPLVLYEKQKYVSISFMTIATPKDGKRDFGLVFFAQNESDYFLYRIDGENRRIGIFRRVGNTYLTIVDKSLAEVGIPFSIENDQTYKLSVNSYVTRNQIDFHFDTVPGYGQWNNPWADDLMVFSLPFKENFGCNSGYLGLRTHGSIVFFDHAMNSAEPAIEGWEIKLEGRVNATTLTGPDGSYCFTNLPPGTYKVSDKVSEIIPPGWEQTYPPAPGYYKITLKPGDQVNCINFGNQPVCLDPPAEMISWWPGDENTLNYADGNNGTFHGVAAYVDGVVGKAFSFDGKNYVQVTDSSNLEPQHITVDAWVRSTAPGQYAYILSKGASECTAASYAFYTGPNGGLYFYVFGGEMGFLSPNAGPGVWDGKWHHIAGTYDGNVVRLYVDGEEVGSGTPASITIDYNLSTTNDLFIGTYKGTCTLGFKGDIDEVEVFGRALSADEIKALYSVGSRGKCKARIDVEKYVSVDNQATWVDADTPPGPEAIQGNNVYFGFRVTNIGNVKLTDITLADTDFSTSSCTIPASLDPGQYFNCVIGPITAVLGQHSNTATATGKYNGLPVSDTDPAHYLGIPKPGEPPVKKFFELTIPQGASLPAGTKVYGYLSNKNYSGSFETTVELTGGPPVYTAGPIILDPSYTGYYDWEIYGVYGTPPQEITFGAGKETITVDKTNKATWIPPGDFRTQTQGGWGSSCAGQNPGCYRDSNFKKCFIDPDYPGLVVGWGGCVGGKTLTFTSSLAVDDFLPQGGTPKALTASYTNPPDLNNVLAGQMVALTLNVWFDYCDPSFGASTTTLDYLVVADPASPCYDWTVGEVLVEGNKILGGCPASSGLNASQINDCVSEINKNFVDGTMVGTFLRLP